MKIFFPVNQLLKILHKTERYPCIPDKDIPSIHEKISLYRLLKKTKILFHIFCITILTACCHTLPFLLTSNMLILNQFTQRIIKLATKIIAR